MELETETHNLLTYCLHCFVLFRHILQGYFQFLPKAKQHTPRRDDAISGSPILGLRTLYAFRSFNSKLPEASEFDHLMQASRLTKSGKARAQCGPSLRLYMSSNSS